MKWWRRRRRAGSLRRRRGRPRRARRRRRWSRRAGAAASRSRRPAGPTSRALTGPPPASMSPDGTKALFICDWNLWVRDVATGQERQLTTDGVKDFGYATSNAGWTTSAAPSLSWSPDGKKIATQQQDERKVGDMYLVETPVNGGHPVLQRVEVSASRRSGRRDDHPRHHRRRDRQGHASLLMAPDFHRAMSEDNIDMGEYLWSPDGTRLGFVSTDRFHKWSTAKLADVTTGEVQDAVHRDGEDARADARAVADSLGHERSALVLAARRLPRRCISTISTTGQLKNKITDGVGHGHRIARLDPATRTMWFDAVGKEKGQDPVLHAPLQGRPRRQELRLADARQRHAHGRRSRPTASTSSTRSRSPTSRRRRRCAMGRRAR